MVRLSRKLRALAWGGSLLSALCAQAKIPPACGPSLFQITNLDPRLRRSESIVKPPQPSSSPRPLMGPAKDTVQISRGAPAFKTTADVLKSLNMNYVYMDSPGRSPVVYSLATHQFGKVEQGKFVPVPESSLPPEGYTGGENGIHFGSLQGPFASIPPGSVNDPLLMGPNALKMTAAIAEANKENSGFHMLKEVAKDTVLTTTVVGAVKSLTGNTRLTPEQIRDLTAKGGAMNWAVVKNNWLSLVNLPVDGLETLIKGGLPKSAAEPMLKFIAKNRTGATIAAGTVAFELSKFMVHQVFMHKFLGWGAGFVKPFLPGLTNRYEMEGGEMTLTLNRTYSLFDPLNEHEALELEERDTGRIINRMWGPVDKPGSPKWNFYMKTLGRERLPPLRQAPPPPVPMDFMWSLWQAQRTGQVRSFAVTDELNRGDNTRMTAAGIPVQRTREVTGVPEVIMGFGGIPTGHVRLHKFDGGYEDVPLSLLRPWTAPFARERTAIQNKVESGGYEGYPSGAASHPASATAGLHFAGSGSNDVAAPVHIVFSSPELQKSFYDELVKDPRFPTLFATDRGGTPGSSDTNDGVRFGAGAPIPSGKSARDLVEKGVNRVTQKFNQVILKALPPNLASVVNLAGFGGVILSVDQLLQYMIHAGNDRSMSPFYSHMDIPGLFEDMPSPEGDGTTTRKRVGAATANTSRGDGISESVSLEGKYGHGARVTFFYSNQDYTGLQFNFDQQKPLTPKDLVDHFFKVVESRKANGRGDTHMRMALNGQSTSPYIEPVYKNLNNWGNFQAMAHPNDQIGPLRFDEPFVGPRITPRDDMWAKYLESAKSQSSLAAFRYELPNPNVPGGVQELVISGKVLEVSRSIHGVPLWATINSPIYGTQTYDFSLMRFGNEPRGVVAPSSQFTNKPLRNNSTGG